MLNGQKAKLKVPWSAYETLRELNMKGKLPVRPIGTPFLIEYN